MAKRSVEVFFGTLERANVDLLRQAAALAPGSTLAMTFLVLRERVVRMLRDHVVAQQRRVALML